MEAWAQLAQAVGIPRKALWSIKLNTSASEILKCCDGSTPVDQIISALEEQLQTTGLRADIEDMLRYAYQENWIG